MKYLSCKRFLCVIIFSALSATGVRCDTNNRIVNIASRYGFPQLHISGSTITVQSTYTTMIFTFGSRKLLFDKTLIWLNAPVSGNNAQEACLHTCDMTRLIEPLLTRNLILSSRNISTIVLDPGHGGKDTGAISPRKIYEKKAVLDIAKRTRKHLSSTGITISLTRTKDTTLSLTYRTETARKQKADLLVSIHLNSAGNTDASGIETYILTHPGFPSTVSPNIDNKYYPGNRFDPESIILAYYVHRYVVAQTKAEDRGIRHARFAILKQAPCPAILIECGFISNPSEEAKILNNKYKDAIAKGIAEGIIEYCKRTGGEEP